jgi:hypothetical protein
MVPRFALKRKSRSGVAECMRSVPALLFMYAKRPRFASYVGEEAYFASIEEAKRGRFAYCIRFSLRPLRIPRSAGL